MPAPQPIRLAVDRKSIAVLATGDGALIDVPRSLLPPGVKPGDVLAVTFAVDHAATAGVATKAKAVQEELKARDPGGDLAL